MSERVTFARSLYLPEAVEAAAAAYAEHAQIDLTPTKDSVVAVISPLGDSDTAVLVNAFCNYVLHETIVRSRRVPPQEVV